MTEQTANDRSPRTLWLDWIIASVAGGILGTLIGGAVESALRGGLGLQARFLVEGLCVGGVQMWVMSRLGVRWPSWLLASALGYLAGNLAAAYAVPPLLEATGLVWPGNGPLSLETLAFGLLVGLAQWVVLRRFLRRAGWWALASLLGWALGWGAAALLANSALSYSRGVYVLLSPALLQAAWALVTGGLLAFGDRR